MFKTSHNLGRKYGHEEEKQQKRVLLPEGSKNADWRPRSNGMINISPVGRNASVQERNDYEKYDKQHGIRTKFVEALKKEFGDFGLTYVLSKNISIISFLPPCN